jgi:hypothetical protein
MRLVVFLSPTLARSNGAGMGHPPRGQNQRKKELNGPSDAIRRLNPNIRERWGHVFPG